VSDASLYLKPVQEGKRIVSGTRVATSERRFGCLISRLSSAADSE
jgi:hypothetical protein